MGAKIAALAAPKTDGRIATRFASMIASIGAISGSAARFAREQLHSSSTLTSTIFTVHDSSLARAARVEFVLVHRPSGTLFITDHFLPPKPGVRVGKPNTVGFRLADEAAARASVRAVLDHKVQRVVFSHGARAECVLEEAATGSILADAYEGLLEAHGVDGPRCEEVAP